jgi:hypothetical protein
MDSTAIHALAAESRQQGGVDVDDAPTVRRDDIRGDQLQVASEHQEVDAMTAEDRHPGSVTGRVRQDLGRDPPLPSQREASRIGPIADYRHELGCRTAFEGAAESVQIAAAAGYGHGYAHRHGGGR